MVFTALMFAFVMPDQPTYPHAKLLVETVELNKPEFAKQLVILDARAKSKFEQGHIPNAVWVDHAAWSKRFGEGTDPKGWSSWISSLGIDRNSKIVVYDDSMSKDAARIWWILRYWGLEDVRLLNGGWAIWIRESMPVEKGAGRTPTQSDFAAIAVSKRLATKQSLLDSLAKSSVQIIDARSEGEFCGTETLRNKKAGAIPGAKHLEWSDLLDNHTQKFKSAQQIQKLFADAGVDIHKPTATHCQGGGRAAVMAFGLELMGATDVSNYYKSFGEWGNADDTPVEPGKPKK
jgi:thiosulfate/3-mercaptopyruvate sulfurtransferase